MFDLFRTLTITVVYSFSKCKSFGLRNFHSFPCGLSSFVNDTNNCKKTNTCKSLFIKHCQNRSSGRQKTLYSSTTKVRPLKSLKNEDNEIDMSLQVLNVAEKNDAAKRIAHLLAGGANNVQMRNTASPYNKIYEFSYQYQGRPCKMVMTSVSGHLLNCEFYGHCRGWNNCDPVELFDARVDKICPENSIKIKQTLEQQAAYAKVLIIWTDCDREGENIGFEIINVCKAINPRLEIKRAKFSEITNMAVERAMRQLGVPDERVSNAVDVRMELDLRIGAAFTRFQTMRLQKKFMAQLQNLVISYGSCQFPTLGFVVERYKAIQEFVPETFYKVEVGHQVDGCSIDFQWARVRLFNELACLTIYEKIIDNPLAVVKKVSSRPKSKWRPVALDTVEFEKLSSRKLRIGAKDAMKIAEKLYTKGIISYPRTETNIFPKGLNLTPLVDQQKNHPQWGGFAQRILQQGGPNPRNGRKTDEAHPPIHPTRFTTELQGNEAKIYELIVRHFLACCSKDAQGHETTVEVEIAEETFVGHGLVILERNYLEVYIYDKWSEKELPHFEQGQEFYPTRIEMNESQTSPPSLLTEADLIALMEKHGIGTDATHAEHIEKIKERTYVGVQSDGRFVPGFLGMGLVEGYDDMGFYMSKPNLRSDLEIDLKKICDGTRNPDDVLHEQLLKYKNVFVQAKRQVEKLDSAIQKFIPQNPPPGPPPQQYQPRNNQNQPRFNQNPRGGGAAAAGSSRGRGATGYANRGTNRGARGGQSSRGGGVANVTNRAARRCGLCHEEGHTRRNCPLVDIANQEDDDFGFD